MQSNAVSILGCKALHRSLFLKIFYSKEIRHSRKRVLSSSFAKRRRLGTQSTEDAGGYRVGPMKVH